MKQVPSLLMSRLHNWAEAAPWVAGLMVLGAALVFWAVYSRRRPAEDSAGAWPWLRAVLEASAAGLLFLAVLWGVRLELNHVERAFSGEHGRITQVNLESVRSIWGEPHEQPELRVTHSVIVTEKEQVPTSPDQAPRFITRQVSRELPQNSLIKTRGAVTIHMNYRRKGSALYACFEDECDFRYAVKNLSDRTTTASCRFAVSPGQGLYTEFMVLVGGYDFADRLSFQNGEARWTMAMKPGEQIPVQVRYKSRGMETWEYSIPEAREVRDFQLVMNLPEVAQDRLDYPEGCLTPTAIAPGPQGQGTTLTWTLDRAITTRGMGVDLPAAPQPGNLVARVLAYAWRGGMLLLVGLLVSLLPGGVRVTLARLALVGGAYCGQTMLLAALSDTRLGFAGALALGALLTLALAALALQWPGRALRPAPAGLVLFFAVIYPLLALPKDAAPALMTVADVALLVYLAGLYLGRVRPAGAAHFAGSGEE